MPRLSARSGRHRERCRRRDLRIEIWGTGALGRKRRDAFTYAAESCRPQTRLCHERFIHSRDVTTLLPKAPAAASEPPYWPARQ